MRSNLLLIRCPLAHSMRSTVLISLLCAFTLTACDTLFDTLHRDSRTNAGYTPQQIESLRVALSKLKFPLPAGSVEHRFGLSPWLRSTAIGDMSPDERGMFVRYIRCYDLNSDYVLIITEGHYLTPSGGTKRRDDSAEIVRRKQLPPFMSDVASRHNLNA